MDEDGNVIDAISIHAPHARSDMGDFLEPCEYIISIHAPHARSDPTLNAINSGNLPFQSTLLMRGATQWAIFSSHASILFQSTLLMRGATASAVRFQAFNAISIHAPHARSDSTTNPGA